MKTLKWRRKWFSNARILGAVTGLALLIQCTPREEASQEPDQLRAQLESARKERDSIQEKLDASTRERVDLDGELNRLRLELEKMKENKEAEPGTR